MREERHFEIAADPIEVRSRLADFLRNEGWTVADEAEVAQATALRCHRRGTWLPRPGGATIAAPGTIDVVISRSSESGVTLVRVVIALRTRWRIVTRIDVIRVRMLGEALKSAAEGRPSSVETRLAPLARPVANAVWANAAMSVLLVGAAGALGQFGILATVGLALAVAGVNVISILGFADLIVEGVERVR